MQDTADPPHEGAEHEARRRMYPPVRQAWTAVLVLSLLNLLAYLDRNILVLFADVIAKDLQLSDVQLGLLFGTAFAIFFSLLALPMGWAIDRYSRRTVIWAGVVAWSLATTACGLARNFAALFTARAVVGAGEAALIPGSQSIIADMFPPDRLALPNSLFGLGNRLGSGLSYIIGGALAALFPASAVFHVFGFGEFHGWQVTLLAIGLPGVLVSFVIFAIPEPARTNLWVHQPKQKSNYGDYFQFVGQNLRFLLTHHGGCVVWVIVSMGLKAWTPAFLTRVHGWEPSQVGHWLGMAMIAGPLIGLPIHGVVVDRMFRRGRRDASLHYIKLALLVAAIPFILAYIVPNPWLTLALIAIGEGIASAAVGTLASGLQLMAPSDLRGKAVSVLILITGFGGTALGPPLVAFLTQYVFEDRQQIGLSLVAFTSVGIPLAALLFWLAQKPMRDRLPLVAA